jgi:DNA-binding NtrC family response regulator
MDMPNVLMIDDDQRFCMAMSKALRRRGFKVEVIHDSEIAVEALLTASKKSVAVLDLKMPQLSGLEILKKTLRREIPVLMLTGHGTVPEAVEAMRAGAYTFLTKPIDALDLEPMILQAHQQLSEQHQQIIFIGMSDSAQQIRSMIEYLADCEEVILITGETGTGKEVVAKSLHESSKRSSAPFVSINLSSLPVEHFEEVLFGAYTHLTDHTLTALVHQVGDGTLFLDAVGELSLSQQSKLLHFLETKRYRPVGGEELIFHGRIIAATHRDLHQEVIAGRFREDLFYRLQIFPISLDPLKYREKDAYLILDYWLQRISYQTFNFTASAKELLQQYSWPGNGREVVNLARRIAVMSKIRHTDEIDTPIIDDSWIHGLLSKTPFDLCLTSQEINEGPSSSSEQMIGEDISLEKVERAHIERLVIKHENLSQVARILGINRRTLQRKLKQWGSSCR